jgi:hypothetical protein
VADSSNVNPGNLVAGAGIPDGTSVVSISSLTGSLAESGVGTSGGSGYVAGDVLAVVQGSASGGILQVESVDQNGQVLSFNPDPVSTGTGYSVAGNLSTTGGTGNGCLVNVTAVSPSVTLSAAPTMTQDAASITVWNAPKIAVVVMQLYVALASASLVQARWLSMWPMAMALYVAHFCTLYANSGGDQNSTLGQIASQGLATGILVSESAGDVSDSFQPVQGLESWGAWNLTTFGQQLATFAKGIGSGPMLVY